MTIKHLNIFLKVFEAEGITDAAEKLGMTQPAVSKAIKELEEHYGVLLFDRIKKKLLPTDKGRELYARALHICSDFERIEEDLCDTETSKLRIGSSVMLGSILMPELAAEYQRRFPNRRLQIKITNRGILQDYLIHGKLDLVLLEDIVNAEELCSEAFTEDRLALVYKAGHPLQSKTVVYLKDLTDYQLMLREKGSASRNLIDSVFSAAGISIAPAWESISTDAILSAVKKGLGITILPEPLVREELLKGNLATSPVMDAPFVRKNYIVWHKDKFINEQMQDMINLCHELTE